MTEQEKLNVLIRELKQDRAVLKSQLDDVCTDHAKTYLLGRLKEVESLLDLIKQRKTLNRESPVNAQTGHKSSIIKSVSEEEIK